MFKNFPNYTDKVSSKRRPWLIRNKQTVSKQNFSLFFVTKCKSKRKKSSIPLKFIVEL